MKKIFFLFPVLYISVVIIFISNYIIDSSQMTYTWGDISIQISPRDKVTQEKLKILQAIPDRTPLKQIRITMPNIKINFLPFTNISERYTDVTLDSISPLPSGEGFVLAFKNNVYLTFQTSVLNPDKFGISIRTQRDEHIRIPFSADFGVSATLNNNSLFLETPRDVSRGVPSASASFIKNSKSFFLQSRGSHGSFRFSKINNYEIQTIDKMPIISPSITQELAQAKEQFLTATVRGLNEQRFNSALGTWVQPEGFDSFSEQSLIVAYAGSLKDNHFSKYRLGLEKSSVINEHSLTWQTAFFNRQAPQIFFEFFAEAEEVQNYGLYGIAEGEREIIADAEVWRSIPFWNSTSRASFLKFIRDSDPINITIENTAMLLYQSLSSDWSEFLAYMDGQHKTLEDNIIQSTVVINDGYMLVDDNKNIEVLSSVIGGTYLAQAGSNLALKRLGARILKTSLSLADANGFLPRSLLIENNEIISLGYINPEEVYQYLTDNVYYPQIKSTNISGIYSYGASQVQLQEVENRLEISIDSKIKDSIQYIYLWKIIAPKSIFAFDLYWNEKILPDNITKGVSYDRNTELLTIKMLNWDEDQKIILSY